MVNANISEYERTYDVNHQYPTYKCNLCNWEVRDNDVLPLKLRMEKHELWHDPRENKKRASKNHVSGEVEWSIV